MDHHVAAENFTDSVIRLGTNMNVSEELERGRHEPRPDPYWKRAHHDWRFWVALVLMLGAMLIYLMTDDLSIVPHIRARPVQSGTTVTGQAR